LFLIISREFVVKSDTDEFFLTESRKVVEMKFFQRCPTRVLFVGLIGASLVALSPLGASAVERHPSAPSIIKATKIALAREGGVRVKVSTTSGSTKSSVIANIGTTRGTETYLAGNESFTITVTPSDAYLNGSAKGLTTLMGLTAIEQKKVGHAAILMKKGSAPYKTFKSNLTVGAFSNLVPPLKGTKLLAKRDHSTNGYQLRWVSKATSTQPETTTTLVISSGASALPLKENVVTASGNSRTVFSRWGEHVKVKVPKSTIAYAKVFS
jgi:hypothetical protein